MALLTGDTSNDKTVVDMADDGSGTDAAFDNDIGAEHDDDDDYDDVDDDDVDDANRKTMAS